MRVFIDSNCPEKQLYIFDMLATATGLYKIADVVLDASESKHICLPLNTSYTLLLSSQTAGIEDPTLASGLEEFYKNKQILGICLKDKCEAFMRHALNKFYPVDTFSALSLNKEVTFDNISRNDTLLLREQLKIGIRPPFYVKLPRRSEVLILNAEGVVSYMDKEVFDLSAECLNEFIASSIELEKISDEQCSKCFDMLNEDITPIYFDSNIDIFNETVTPELVINYKKKLVDFFKKVANQKEYQSYLGLNKNALLLADMINSNRELFDKLYKD